MQYVPGLVSLVLSAFIILYLIHLDQNETNASGLLVEAAGIFAEIFLIIIVIDQLDQYRERRRWRSLHSSMGQTLQRAFVDLMRVNYIFKHPATDDSSRLSEFIDFSRFSLSDLRSHIESFTTSLDVDKQHHIRLIERQLNYLFRNFHSLSLKDREKYSKLDSVNYENYIFFQSKDNWRVFSELSSKIGAFLEGIGSRRDKNETKAAKQAVTRVTSKFPDGLLEHNRFYQTRFAAQQIAIDILGLQYVLLDDTDQTNSVYFFIDQLLLSKLSRSVPPGHRRIIDA